MSISGASPAGSWKQEAVEMTTVAAPQPAQDFDLEDDNQQHKSMRTDAQNMQRMGRNQEFVRHFRQLSLVSFVAISTAAWELTLFQIGPGLINGGSPALIYSNIWNFIGFTPIYLSMAEMASMAPIAGAQYHWVSEFAPEKYQKILSYFTGWTSTLAWQAGNASGLFLVGTLIQSMIAINDPTYTSPSWHAWFLVVGVTAIAIAANIYGSKAMPYWQNAIFAIHVAAFFAFLIPVWVNAPMATEEQVWTEFENLGGWSTMALSIMIGQSPTISGQTGIDTAAHMSEEVRNAATTVPKAMMVIFTINFLFNILTTLTIVYHVPDANAALGDPTTYPSIYVLRQSMSQSWLNVLLVCLILLLMFSNMSYLSATSRDLWAFSRDHGLPFAGWISKVNKGRNIPQNALLISGGSTILLGFIYIGSPLAFYGITSLCIVALLQCYCLSIGCLLWRRIFYPETLPCAPFSLGKWGIPINAAAVIYALWSFFWMFWPQAYPVTASGFNWASAIFVAVLLGSLVYYVVSASKKWHGPVVLVEGRKVHTL